MLQRKMPGLKKNEVNESGRTNEHGNKMVDGKLCNSAVISIIRIISKFCGNYQVYEHFIADI